MMTLELLTKVTVLAWPILIALAILATLFMPDLALRKERSGAETLVERLWQLAAGWLIILLLVLSVPHEGDVTAIGWAPLAAIYSEAWASLSTPWVITGLALYAAAGLAWTITYFGLYARRLGLKYVFERDLWMQAGKLKTLEGLTPEQRKDFAEKVVQKVKGAMLYEGDFPLRSLQQKRFFGANWTFWPATLAWYFVGDFAMDVARRIWFALRGRIHSYWERGMSEYLADDALCKAFQVKLEKERQEKLDAAAREEAERANSRGIKAFMPGLNLFKRQED